MKVAVEACFCILFLLIFSPEVLWPSKLCQLWLYNITAFLFSFWDLLSLSVTSSSFFWLNLGQSI